MDQYIIRHHEFITSGNPEHALIDPDNPLILLEHLKCAAFEIPFVSKDSFGDIANETLTAYLNALVLLNLLVERNGKYFWITDDYPSGNLSLRNISGNPIQLRLGDIRQNKLIGVVDFQSALRIVHPGAVYMHDGNSYIVEQLSIDENIAWLSPHKDNYYTEPRTKTEIEVETLISKSESNNWDKSFGELHVTEHFKGYKKIDWETLMPLGIYDLDDLPYNDLHTKGVWLSLSEKTVDFLRKNKYWQNDSNDYGNEWEKVRLSIIQRDDFRCQVCNIELDSKQLHVHHKTPFRSFSDVHLANNSTNLVTLCPNCHRKVEQNVRIRSGLSGVAYLLGNLAPLHLLCDSRDIGYFSEPESDLCEKKPVIVVYDQFPGGIGLSAKLYELMNDILFHSLEIVNLCVCEQGCPSCVGPAGENGVGGKIPAREILKLMLDN